MAVQVKHPYVEKEQGVCGGRAAIKGTRIPVWLIFRRYRSGEALEEIQEAYPSLKPSQILDALGYAFDNLEEILQDIAENTEEYWRERKSPSSSPST